MVKYSHPLLKLAEGIMSANRTPGRFSFSSVWIEYLLILILIALIIAILVSLLGPYVSNQVAQFMAQIASRPPK